MPASGLRRQRGSGTETSAPAHVDGLAQFEVVTDVQDTVFDDPHDDGSPPSDPEGGFHIEHEW